MAKDKPAPEPAPDAPEKPRSARKALPVVTQNRLFAGLILIVTLAFLLSLIGLGLLAILGKEPPTALQTKFADACDFTLKVTLGALVGLLGGRAAAPDRLEISDRT
ncbi:MAG: hypothetical protein K2V38_16670 [Gemmataceae bacterium]|nr:hypothetical protein [Gemmataceae bacterium]